MLNIHCRLLFIIMVTDTQIGMMCYGVRMCYTESISGSAFAYVWMEKEERITLTYIKYFLLTSQHIRAPIFFFHFTIYFNFYINHGMRQHEDLHQERRTIFCSSCKLVNVASSQW